MPEPLFSIVIPTFNRANTIAATLRSIESQVFSDFEVIVVDDGSEDDTCRVVESFTGLDIDLIRQPNSGPGAARNRGVEAARGLYIAFLDSDDLWFPWTLETYASVIAVDDQPHFVTGKPLLFHDQQELDDCELQPPAHERFADYYESSDRWRWFGVSSFVILRETFAAVGGFASGRINGEDADLAMKLGTSPGFVHITQPAQFAYRLHEGNITNVSEKSQAGLELLVRKNGTGQYPGGKKRARQRSEIIARHVRPFAISKAKQGDVSTAARFYLAIVGESMRRWRLRFLLGVPALASLGWLRRTFGVTENDH